MDAVGPTVTDLSLEQKVGQVLCLGWQDSDAKGNAKTANAHARALVEELGAGSLIVMGRNVGTPEETRSMLGELQELAALPLFVAVDQEGGSVNRFGPPFTAFPGNMALGATGENAIGLARAQGTVQAEELKAVGVNWNFAPVLDVNSNPDNPIIGIRSFGSDPARVAELGAAMIAGYQENGLLACAKHFPGHGDTSVDSHLALPTITGDRVRLDAVELVPFRSAIAAGVGAIMTTHILFPALDPLNPATLSPAILTGLLRNELGYNGIVITDCLEMNAIADGIGTARGAVEALKAGADVVLICHTLFHQRAARQAILDAVRSGELPEARLNEAVGRVLAAKQRFPATPYRSALLDVGDFDDSEIDQAEGMGLLEPVIAEASITVVREDAKQGVRLDVTALLVVASAHACLPELAEVLQQHGKLTTFALPPDFAEAQTTPILEEIEKMPGRVIVATSPPQPWTKKPINAPAQAQFVRALHARIGTRLIVVALREPYDLRGFSQVKNYICTYGTQPASLNALAAALYGNFVPTGKLSVTLGVGE